MDTLKRYNVGQLGRVDRYQDPSKKDEERGLMSEAKKDAYNSLLNLILTHKKEIVKVPACSTFESATQWAKKRPGFRVDKKNIGGDEEEEVVVYDRNGNPFIINGYKMAPSDYGFRKAYYTANDTAEKRAGYSMKDWKNEVLYKTVKTDNPWKHEAVRPTKTAMKLREQGWKLPTKPKLQQSVYSIFSKLISPFVKEFFETEKFAAIAGSAQNNINENCSKFLKKVISPITIYRYLYMKLVLRNYFFNEVNDKKIEASYKVFEQYVKTYKNRFFDWFCRNYLTKDMKDFRASRITANIVKRNLVDGDLNTDGSDVNDGLAFLIGLDNINDQNPIFSPDGRNTYTFTQILLDGDVSALFLEALKDKKDRKLYSLSKKLLTRFKARAQRGAKEFFSEKLKRQFFENDTAFEIWKNGAEYGCFTLTSEAALEEHEADGGQKSPARPSQNVPEEKAADQKKVEEEDDAEIPSAEEEDGGDEGGSGITPQELDMDDEDEY